MNSSLDNTLKQISTLAKDQRLTKILVVSDSKENLSRIKESFPEAICLDYTEGLKLINKSRPRDFDLIFAKSGKPDENRPWIVVINEPAKTGAREDVKGWREAVCYFFNAAKNFSF